MNTKCRHRFSSEWVMDVNGVQRQVRVCHHCGRTFPSPVVSFEIALGLFRWAVRRAGWIAYQGAKLFRRGRTSASLTKEDTHG